jgi:hypothetical protein
MRAEEETRAVAHRCESTSVRPWRTIQTSYTKDGGDLPTLRVRRSPLVQACWSFHCSDSPAWTLGDWRRPGAEGLFTEVPNHPIKWRVVSCFALERRGYASHLQFGEPSHQRHGGGELRVVQGTGTRQTDQTRREFCFPSHKSSRDGNYPTQHIESWDDYGDQWF